MKGAKTCAVLMLMMVQCAGVVAQDPPELPNFGGAGEGDAEWQVLRAHIHWCYTQIVARCRMLGDPPIEAPSYVNPTDDYLRFARWIDENAGRFVDYTQAGGGDFNQYLGTYEETGDYQGWFRRQIPTFRPEQVREYQGQTNWVYNGEGLRSWAAIERRKEWLEQIVQAIGRLRWTWSSVSWDSVHREPAGGSGVGEYYPTFENWGQAVGRLQWWYTDQGYQSSSASPPSTGFGGWRVWEDLYWTWIWRSYGVARVSRPWTELAAEVELYCRVLPAYDPWPEQSDPLQRHVVDLDGDALNAGPVELRGDSQNWRFDSPLVLQARRMVEPTTDPIEFSFGDPQLRTPPACEDPVPDSASRGYRTEGWVAVIKWVADWGGVNQPPPNPYEENPPVGAGSDTDRDDLLDMGVDLRSRAASTGAILWHPAQDDPYVILPISIVGGAVPVADYLTETPVLPYHIRAESVYADGDGYRFAKSLNTRILQSVIYTNEVPVKRVSLLRPRGQLVVFEFPWDGSQFSAVGHPIGIHASRTYVLRDRTPTVHEDFEYDLLFESGVVHRFNRWGLDAVENALRQRWDWSAWWQVGGASYWAEVTWPEEGAGSSIGPQRVTYASDPWFGGVVADVTIHYDEQQRVSGLSKTGMPGIQAFNYTLNEARTSIVRGEGALVSSRTADGGAGQARTVTIATSIPGGGVWTVQTSFDSNDYVTSQTWTWGPSSFTRTFQRASGSGRYTNGLLKCSRVVRMTDSEGGWADYRWDPITGWLTEITVPTAWGPEKTAYSYAAVSGFDPAEIWRLVELPRLAVSKVGEHETARVHTQFKFSNEVGHITVTQREPHLPGGGWTAPGLQTVARLDPYVPTSVVVTAVGVFSTRRSYDWWWCGDVHLSSTGPEGAESVTLTAEGFGVAYTSHYKGEAPMVITCTARDEYGRPTEWTYPDGSLRQVLEYCIHGPTRIRERDGSERLLEYDALGRLVREEYLGRVTHYEYDALGRLTRVRQQEGNAQIETSADYDVLGRLLRVSDPIAIRTFQYTADNGLWTITATDNAEVTGDLILVVHPDGNLKSIGGAGAGVPIACEYGFGTYDGQTMRTITVRRGGEGSEEWTRTYYDLLGRPRYREQNGVAGGTALDYDAASRLRKVTDPLGLIGLLEYPAEGRIPSVFGLKRGGDPDTLLPGGKDRMATMSAEVGSVSCSVFTTDQNPTPTLFASAWVAPNGLSASASYAGRSYACTRTAFAPGGAFDLTVQMPADRLLEISHQQWRPASAALKDGETTVETEAYAYTAFDLLQSVTHSIEGRTEFEYDAQWRLVKIRAPGGKTTTITYYPHTDWIRTVKAPGRPTATYEYYPNGLVKSIVRGVERIEYEYDARGRLSQLSHWNGDTHRSATRYTWHPQTGRLQSLSRAGWVRNEQTGEWEPLPGSDQGTWTYTWKANGDFEHAIHPSGATIQAAYTDGDLTALTYTDGVTTPLSYSYDRMGRVIAAGYAGQVEEQYTLHLDGSTLSTAIAGNLVPAHSFARTYTPAGEPTGWTLSAGGVQRTYSVSRNGAGRVTGLSDAGLAAAYTPAAVGPGVGVVNLGAIRAEYGWGAGGTQLTNLVWKTSSGAPLVGFTQAYDEEEPTRVVRRARLDGSTWHYLYDEHGRLIEAALRDAGGQLLPGGLYRYRYDQAGNPVTGGPVEGGNPLWAFEHAGHLQVRRLWGNRVEVLGEAAEDAAVGVSVDGGPLVRAEKSGTRFRCVVEVPALAAGAKDVRIEVIAARQEGPNAIVQRTRGRVYLPKADEALTRDAAGRLRVDSRWEYTWNLRGQLLRAESKHRNPNVRLDYFYYPSGPMMRREKREWVSGQWRLVSTTTWTVDGWRPVTEFEQRAGGGTVERWYTWGLDLAGWRDRRSLDESGGIGGLLAVRERINGGDWTTYYVLSDPQGNVVGLATADGTLVAQYDYDPYGRLIRETGPKATSCPFRYSTKYRDPDLELYYYGYRWYDAAAMKWLTPDPIGERGGFNLTAFCSADPINHVDPLGLATMEETLLAFRVLYGEQGERFLSAFLKEGYISLENVWGDLKLKYHPFAPAGRSYELEIEKDLNPFEAAQLLWVGLSERAVAEYQIRRHLEEIEDIEAARAAAVRRAAEVTARGAELYLAGLTVLNEGADWAMAIHDISEGRFASALAFLPLISSAMTRNSRLFVRFRYGDSVIHGLRLIGDPLSYVPRQYRRGVREAFEGAPVAIRLDQPLTVYRHWCEGIRERGHWLALKPYARRGNARRYLALPKGNTAEYVTEFKIPAGTVILLGTVRSKADDLIQYGEYAIGGGLQVYLPDRSVLEWIRRIR